MLLEAGVEVTIGHDAANVPEGAEVVASSAIPADIQRWLGARCAAVRSSWRVARAWSLDCGRRRPRKDDDGVHDRVLPRPARDDPTFVIGGHVPQLGAGARQGTGWTVAEGDESDGSLLELPATIAVVTNIDHDHHSAFASRAEVEHLFAAWLAGTAAGATVIRGDDVALDAGVSLAVPGEHNRQNAACAVEALVSAGFERAAVEDVVAGFTGVARRLEAHGVVDGVALFDDYAHHPAEVAATLGAARSLLEDDGRLVVLFQPHLYSRTAYMAHEFGAALAAADAVCVTEIYPAREQPLPGVTARLVVDALAARRPGMRLGVASSIRGQCTTRIAVGASRRPHADGRRGRRSRRHPPRQESGSRDRER